MGDTIAMLIYDLIDSQIAIRQAPIGLPPQWAVLKNLVTFGYIFYDIAMKIAAKNRIK